MRKKLTKKELNLNTASNTWTDMLSIKQLKFEVCQRGLEFEQISSMSVLQLQGWLLNNLDTNIDLNRLVEYDKHLRGVGGLDFGLLGFKMDTPDDEKREILEYNEHKTDYKPRAGTRKEYTHQLVAKGLPTKEIIAMVFKEFGRTNPQSIKSWCSRFRAQLKNIAHENSKG